MHTGQLSCSDSFQGFYLMSSPVMEATTTHIISGNMELSLSLTLWSQVPRWQQEPGIRDELRSYAPLLWPGNESRSHKEQEILPTYNLMSVCCAVYCSPVTQSRTWIIPSRWHCMFFNPSTQCINSQMSRLQKIRSTVRTIVIPILGLSYEV